VITKRGVPLRTRRGCVHSFHERPERGREKEKGALATVLFPFLIRPAQRGAASTCAFCCAYPEKARTLGTLLLSSSRARAPNELSDTRGEKKKAAYLQGVRPTSLTCGSSTGGKKSAACPLRRQQKKKSNAAGQEALTISAKRENGPGAPKKGVRSTCGASPRDADGKRTLSFSIGQKGKKEGMRKRSSSPIAKDRGGRTYSSACTEKEREKKGRKSLQKGSLRLLTWQQVAAEKEEGPALLIRKKGGGKVENPQLQGVVPYYSSCTGGRRKNRFHPPAKKKKKGGREVKTARSGCASLPLVPAIKKGVTALPAGHPAVKGKKGRTSYCDGGPGLALFSLTPGIKEGEQVPLPFMPGKGEGKRGREGRTRICHVGRRR